MEIFNFQLIVVEGLGFLAVPIASFTSSLPRGKVSLAGTPSRSTHDWGGGSSGEWSIEFAMNACPPQESLGVASSQIYTILKFVLWV
jgi:hypothetical protein